MSCIELDESGMTMSARCFEVVVPTAVPRFYLELTV